MPSRPDILTTRGAGLVCHEVVPVVMLEPSPGWFDADQGDRHREEQPMRRLANAFTALLFGSGILVLCVGLFSPETYNWKLGVIGMVTLWVIAWALRVYLISRSDE
jgi:hypothetical protein